MSLKGKKKLLWAVTRDKRVFYCVKNKLLPFQLYFYIQDLLELFPSWPRSSPLHHRPRRDKNEIKVWRQHFTDWCSCGKSHNNRRLIILTTVVITVDNCFLTCDTLITLHLRYSDVTVTFCFPIGCFFVLLRSFPLGCRLFPLLLLPLLLLKLLFNLNYSVMTNSQVAAFIQDFCKENRKSVFFKPALLLVK